MPKIKEMINQIYHRHKEGWAIKITFFEKKGILINQKLFCDL